MEIKHSALAGTMESSDALVQIEPGTGIQLTINSPVIHQYGKRIRAVVLDTLHRLEIENAAVSVLDRGALDCTLKARVESAVFRAADQSEAKIPWGGAVT